MKEKYQARDKSNTEKSLGSEILSKRIVQASYRIAWEIAKAKKCYTEGEFIKKCLNEAVGLICPEQKNMFEKLKLSRRTIGRRVVNISNDIQKQLEVKVGQFMAYSIAIDESTDITDTAQLVLFIRGVDEKLVINEYLLDLIPLMDTTTGDDIFKAFCSSVEKRNLDWSKLISVTTDGAPCMAGEKKGFVGRLKSYLTARGRSDTIYSFHCIIHQQVLSSKIANVESVMNVVVKTINKIKSKSLKHRQFRQLLKEMGDGYEDMAYYTQVRWLSRGKMLKRFFDLRNTISDFFNKQVQFAFQ